MRKVALSEVKDDLSRFLRLAEKEEVVITRHGKVAGVLIGFESEDDWFDYRLENDPRFLHRVEAARESLPAGKGVTLEALAKAGGPVPNNRSGRSRASRLLLRNARAAPRDPAA
jgi:prevent-host-death family protein